MNKEALKNAAMLVFGITVLLSVLYSLRVIDHSRDNHDMLMFACGIAGSISGMFFGATVERWWIGILPGAIGGLGSFLIFESYMHFFHRHSIFTIEAILVCLAGTIPGWVFYWIETKVIPKKGN